MRISNLRPLFGYCMLLGLLGACQAAPIPTPTPNPTATPAPLTATPVPPTPTITASPTSEPSATEPVLVTSDSSLTIPASAFGLQIIHAPTFSNGAGKASQPSGAGLIHLGIEWGWLTGNVFSPPSQYKWQNFDTAINLAHELGYEVMVTLGGNPAWAAEFARGPINCPGYEDLSQYHDYVQAVVERYHDRVQKWAVYNEPDAADFVREQPSCLNRNTYAAFGDHPEDYVKTLRLTYETVKAIDPDALVYLGGIAFDAFTSDGGYFQRDFLANVLQAGGADYFDQLNFHYYPTFDAGWEKLDPTQSALAIKTQTLLDLMHSAGVEKPFVVTEIGATSSEKYGGTAESQAAQVVKLYSRILAAGGQLGVWYNMNDYGSSGSDYFEYHGLLTAQNKLKPSFTAYQFMTSQLTGASFPTLLPTDWLGNQQLEGYQYDLPATQETLYVIWGRNGADSALHVPDNAKIWDMLGNPLTTLPTTLGSEPLYIRVGSQ